MKPEDHPPDRVALRAWAEAASLKINAQTPESLEALSHEAIRQMLHELREKEERLSLATLHNGIGIWDWNLITRKMVWDDSMFALYHLRRADFIGTEEAWRASLHPNDLERGDQEVADAISGKKPFDTEFRVIWPNGEIHHIKAVARIFRDERGTPLRMLGTNWDITARKLAEEALLLANQKMRLFFEQTPLAVIEWDMDFRVTRWNPAARTIFGFSQAEAVGQHASFIVPEAFRSHVDQVWQGLLKQSGGERSSNENVRKDGRMILCEWYNTPLIDDRGIFTGAASAVMDITERTQALQLLAWEKNALEMISSATTLHAVLRGLMLGLENQLPGALCSVLLLDTDGLHLRHGAGPNLPEAYNRLIDGVAIGPAVGSCGTAAYADRQVIVADIASDPLWADYRELALSHGLRACWSTPIHGSQGKILGTFAIYYREPREPVPAELELMARAVHVTRIAIERKHAEEEILHLNASLEERVRERTAQFETALKELDSFSYSVSHDLRAPLRAVDGFSRMVVADYGEKLDDEGRRMLGVIRSETLRMGRLIDDLLAFARLGRQTIESAMIDMRALAQGVFDELAALEPERKLRLDLGSLPTARGTHAMIRQVWVNLIGNAIKFTQERAVGEIEIGAREDAEAGCVYFIKDNGAGFDMRHAGKLFGVFQRLHTQQAFEGTGVGLALVQRIVQRHGGRIWAVAEVGRGATFSFTLPQPTP